MNWNMQNSLFLINKSWENGRKHHFGRFWSKFQGDICFSANFVALVAKKYRNEQECAKWAKSNEANSRNWLKPIFRTNFRGLGPISDPQNFFSGKLVRLAVKHRGKLSKYAKWAKSNEANSRKWPKTNFGTNFDVILPKFGPNHFFIENPTSSLF